MTPTLFQKLAVDHVSIHNDAAPLDYPALKDGGFEAVYFRPEEGVDTVSQRINYARGQRTFRGTRWFDGNVWFADPSSTDSIAAGIPTDATGWANYVVGFVKALRAKALGPAVLKLNVEFTAKGYPPRMPGVLVPPWMHAWAAGADGVKRLYYTPTGGTTGVAIPKWTGVRNVPVVDNDITWYLAEDPYPYWRGWAWNETVAKIIRAGLPDQAIITQPMGHQADFNRGAWWSRGCRESPQCYGDQPYVALLDPGAEINAVDTDPYAKAYYGLDLDRRLVHPTIGAYGQGSFYVPRLKLARQTNVFGFAVYRHDAFTASDYSDYRQFAVT